MSIFSARTASGVAGIAASPEGKPEAVGNVGAVLHEYRFDLRMAAQNPHKLRPTVSPIANDADTLRHMIKYSDV